MEIQIISAVTCSPPTDFSPTDSPRTFYFPYSRDFTHKPQPVSASSMFTIRIKTKEFFHWHCSRAHLPTNPLAFGQHQLAIQSSTPLLSLLAGFPKQVQSFTQLLQEMRFSQSTYEATSSVGLSRQVLVC